MNTQPYRFIFIIGAEGSGTTMLTRIISSPDRCIGLGGNHFSMWETDGSPWQRSGASESESFFARSRRKFAGISAIFRDFPTQSWRKRAARSSARPLPRADGVGYGLARKFNKANDKLWDRFAPADKSNRGRARMTELIDEVLALPEYKAVSHVVFKRSAPFHRGDRYRPDLSDVLEIFDDVRIIVIYRDPRASSASALRRGFAKNLRRCSIITEEQLTLISAQLSTLDDSVYLGLAYEDFCREPVAYSERIADHCGLPRGLLLTGLEAEKVDASRNEGWRRRLGEEDIAWLTAFFDERRRRQWPVLSGLTDGK